MKRNSSIQALTILMAVMFFSSGQILAASASAPKVKGVASTITIANVQEGMEKVGPDDSALVVSGKVNMGGADYYAVSPAPTMDFSTKPSDGTIWIYMVPQLKSNEAAGYKAIYRFGDTGKNAKMWKYFRDFTQLTMTGVIMNVRKTESAKWEQWDITSPSLPKTYPVSPVQPK
jgi:hypothetical protein